jgi:uncharacterized surface protein with fasciclin (FAS1) repeats
MKRIRIMIAVVALVALAGGAVVSSAAGGTARGDIVQTAAQAGKFKTLTKLLKRAGLVGVLEQPGPYTVFAPSDAAFAKVPKKRIKALLADRAKLRSVLLYHVLAGKVTSAGVVKRSSATTLNGKDLRIRVVCSKVFVNRARVTTADVMASNGVIHVINRVLIPR